MIHHTNSNNGPAWSRDRGYHTPEGLPDHITRNSNKDMNKSKKKSQTSMQSAQSVILHPYFGSDMLDEYALLIFAPNRQQAKVLLNQNMPHSEYEYTDLRVRRAKDDYMLLAESDKPHVRDSFPWPEEFEQDGGEPSWNQYLQKVKEAEQ